MVGAGQTPWLVLLLSIVFHASRVRKSETRCTLPPSTLLCSALLMSSHHTGRSAYCGGGTPYIRSASNGLSGA